MIILNYIKHTDYSPYKNKNKIFHAQISFLYLIIFSHISRTIYIFSVQFSKKVEYIKSKLSVRKHTL